MSFVPFHITHHTGVRHTPSPDSVILQLYQSHVVTPVNMSENRFAYFITLNAPALTNVSIYTSIVGDILTMKVQGDRKEDGMTTTAVTLYKSFSLPENVSRERLRTSYKDGVVKLVLPKKTRKRYGLTRGRSGLQNRRTDIGETNRKT